VFKQKNMNSAIKGLSWLIACAAATFIAVYVITHKTDSAASVSVIVFIIQIPLYWGYERLWDRFNITGRKAKAFVLWFTGLSGSGKSTLADIVYTHLEKKGYKVTRLDGDTVRSIFPNTGFSRDERNNHIRRVGYLASILEKNGIIVISSFVSPYAESRDFVRNMCGNFIEVFVTAPLEECERRDVKGLYKKARAGEIKNFTGIDDPYEPPARPEITIHTENRTVDESAAVVISYIQQYL
jgi:adenylylsulfate kinase